MMEPRNRPAKRFFAFLRPHRVGLLPYGLALGLALSSTAFLIFDVGIGQVGAQVTAEFSGASGLRTASEGFLKVFNEPSKKLVDEVFSKTFLSNPSHKESLRRLRTVRDEVGLCTIESADVVYGYYDTQT